jgi:hypothetical protein
MTLLSIALVIFASWSGLITDPVTATAEFDYHLAAKKIE